MEGYLLALCVWSICTVWYAAFGERKPRWPDYVYDGVKKYVAGYPTFYIEELQMFIATSFPEVKNRSTSTICRVLRFDAARESVPAEIEAYRFEMRQIFMIRGLGNNTWYIQ